MIPIVKPLLGKDEETRVIEVLRSGQLAAGKYVREFEDEFKSYNSSRFATATSSGTTALHVILKALDIGQGDKVFTTPFTFIATSNAILYTGATPVFVDIDPLTYNISATDLAAKIQEHPDAKAILVVHLFGLPADMKEIMDLATKHNLIVLEDCAQAHGAAYEGKKVGNFGMAAAYSFYPTKNMTSGEGGIVLTNDPSIDEKVKILVNQGQRQRYYHEVLGFNYRMTNVHAAIGLEQLKKLEIYNQKRRENAQFYNQSINNSLVNKPVAPPNRTHVYHQYTLRVAAREAFTAYLTEKGIGYGVYYPLLNPAQEAYRNLPCSIGSWPVAEGLANNCVSIPVHPALTRKDLIKIVETINRYS